MHAIHERTAAELDRIKSHSKVPRCTQLACNRLLQDVFDKENVSLRDEVLAQRDGARVHAARIKVQSR